jgi:hypothetical protein
MKLALHTSYGNFKYPKGFTCVGNSVVERAELFANWLESRTDIPVIDDKLVITDAIFDKVIEMLSEPDSVGVVHIKIKDFERYAVVNAISDENYTHMSLIKIEELDIDDLKAKKILWSIDEYDGTQCIGYYVYDSDNHLRKVSRV